MVFPYPAPGNCLTSIIMPQAPASNIIDGQRFAIATPFVSFDAMAVLYDTSFCCYFADACQSEWLGDAMAMVQLASHINLCQPTWGEFVEADPVFQDTLNEGESFFDGFLFDSVQIVLSEIGPQINRWWGSEQFGKYGVCGPGGGTRPHYGDSSFVNFPNSYHIMHKKTDAFYVNLFPGCKGDIYFFKRFQIPGVWYWTPGDDWYEYGPLT